DPVTRHINAGIARQVIDQEICWACRRFAWRWPVSQRSLPAALVGEAGVGVGGGGAPDDAAPRLVADDRRRRRRPRRRGRARRVGAARARWAPRSRGCALQLEILVG